MLLADIPGFPVADRELRFSDNIKINDANQIVLTAERGDVTDPTTSIHRYSIHGLSADGEICQGCSVTAEQIDASGNGFSYDRIESIAAINQGGRVVFVATDNGNQLLVEERIGPDLTRELPGQAQSLHLTGDRLLVASTDFEGLLGGQSIVLLSEDFGEVEPIAAPSSLGNGSTFSSLGNTPGVSADSSIVAFVGIPDSRTVAANGWRIGESLFISVSSGGNRELHQLLTEGQFGGIGLDADSPIGVRTETGPGGATEFTVLAKGSVLDRVAGGDRDAIFSFTGRLNADGSINQLNRQPKVIAVVGAPLSDLNGPVRSLQLSNSLTASGQAALRVSTATEDVILAAEAFRRPLIVIPDIGSSFFGNQQDQLLRLGVNPDSLSTNPLAENFERFTTALQSDQFGYTGGKDLFISHYDWRLPLFPGTAEDPAVNQLTDQSLGDDQIEFGIDYLAHTLEQIRDQLPGTREVDVVAHGAGAAILKAYLLKTSAEAAAVGAVAGAAIGSLPTVGTAVMIDPAAGTSFGGAVVSTVWPEVASDFDRIVLKIQEKVFQLIKQKGVDLIGPDGQPINRDRLIHDGQLDPRKLIKEYLNAFKTIGGIERLIESGELFVPQIQLGDVRFEAPQATTFPTFEWSLPNIDINSIEKLNFYLSVESPSNGLLPDPTPGFEDMLGPDKTDVNPTRILTKSFVRTAGDEIPTSLNLFDFGVAYELTASQEYHWAVEAIVPPDNALLTESVVAVGSFRTPAVQGESNEFSSVTLITHGFQLPYLDTEVPADFRELARLVAATNNGIVLEYQPDSGRWHRLTKQGDDSFAVSENAATPTEILEFLGRPLVLVSDWVADSSIGDRGFSEAAADAIFSGLVQLNDHLGDTVFQSDMHVAGFSRGTIVTSEIVQRLGVHFGDRVGGEHTDLHMTVLDSHDFRQDALAVPLSELLIALQVVPLGPLDVAVKPVANSLQALTSLTGAVTIPYDNFREPQVTAWNNATFVDTYWQNVGGINPATGNTDALLYHSFTPNGRSLGTRFIAASDVGRTVNDLIEEAGGIAAGFTNAEIRSRALAEIDAAAAAIGDADRSRPLTDDDVGKPTPFLSPLLSPANVDVDVTGRPGFAADTPSVSLAGSDAGLGIGGPHMRVKSWYAGTLDLAADDFYQSLVGGTNQIWRHQTPAGTDQYFQPGSDGELNQVLADGTTKPFWYVARETDAAALTESQEGVGTGWAYSKLGGATRPEPIQGGAEKPDPNSQFVATVFNGDFDQALVPNFGRFPIPLNWIGVALEDNRIDGIIDNLIGEFLLPFVTSSGINDATSLSDDFEELVAEYLATTDLEVLETLNNLPGLEGFGDRLVSFLNPSWREVPGWAFHGGSGGLLQGGNLVSFLTPGAKDQFVNLIADADPQDAGGKGLRIQVAEFLDEQINDVLPDKIKWVNLVLEPLDISIGKALEGIGLAMLQASEQGILDHAFELADDDQLTHNRMYIPPNQTSLLFDYFVPPAEQEENESEPPTDDDATLEVSFTITAADGSEQTFIGGYVPVSQPTELTDGAVDFLTTYVDVPQQVQGKVATLTVRRTVTDAKNPIVEAVLLDNFRLINLGVEITDSSGDANDELLFFYDTNDPFVAATEDPDLNGRLFDSADETEGENTQVVLQPFVREYTRKANIHEINIANNTDAPLTAKLLIGDNQFLVYHEPGPAFEFGDNGDFERIPMYSVPGGGVPTIQRTIAPNQTETFTFDAQLPSGFMAQIGPDDAPIQLLDAQIVAHLTSQDSGFDPVSVTHVVHYLVDAADENYTDNIIRFPTTLEGKQRLLRVETPAGVQIQVTNVVDDPIFSDLGSFAARDNSQIVFNAGTAVRGLPIGVVRGSLEFVLPNRGRHVINGELIETNELEQTGLFGVVAPQYELQISTFDLKNELRELTAQIQDPANLDFLPADYAGFIAALRPDDSTAEELEDRIDAIASEFESAFRAVFEGIPQGNDSSSSVARQHRNTRELEIEFLSDTPGGAVRFTPVANPNQVDKIALTQRGAGFDPNNPPEVTFLAVAPPNGHVLPEARAVVRPDGRLDRIEVVSRGRNVIDMTPGSLSNISVFIANTGTQPAQAEVKLGSTTRLGFVDFADLGFYFSTFRRFVTNSITRTPLGPNDPNTLETVAPEDFLSVHSRKYRLDLSINAEQFAKLNTHVNNLARRLGGDISSIEDLGRRIGRTTAHEFAHNIGLLDEYTKATFDGDLFGPTLMSRSETGLLSRQHQQSFQLAFNNPDRDFDLSRNDLDGLINFWQLALDNNINNLYNWSRSNKNVPNELLADPRITLTPASASAGQLTTAEVTAAISTEPDSTKSFLAASSASRNFSSNPVIGATGFSTTNGRVAENINESSSSHELSISIIGEGLITDPQGRSLGFLAGKVINEIPGAIYVGESIGTAVIPEPVEGMYRYQLAPDSDGLAFLSIEPSSDRLDGRVLETSDASIDGSFEIRRKDPDFDIGDLIEIAPPTIGGDLTLTISPTATTVNGEVFIESPTIAILPDRSTLEDDGLVTGTEFRLTTRFDSLDPFGTAFALQASTADASIAGLLNLSATGTRTEPAVTLSIDPNAAPTDTLFQLGPTTVVVPVLEVDGKTPSGVVDGFGLRNDGTPFVSSVQLNVPAGYGFGLLDFLPVELNELSVAFPQPDDLDQLVIGAAGRFKTEDLESLLPSSLGDVTPIIQVRSDTNGEFSFDFAIDSLVEGQIRPLNLGPITIGLEGLEVGSFTLNGSLTWGGILDGVIQNDVGGTFAFVTSDPQDPFAGLSIGVLPGSSLTTTDDGMILNVNARITFEGDFTGQIAGVDVAGTSVDLAFLLETSAIEAAPFIVVDRATIEFISLTIDQIDFEIENFVRVFSTELSVFEPGQFAGEIARVGNVTIDFLGPFDELGQGTIDDLRLFEDRIEFANAQIDVADQLGGDAPLLSFSDLSLLTTDFVFDLDTNQIGAGTIGLVASEADLLDVGTITNPNLLVGLNTTSFEFAADGLTADLGGVIILTTGALNVRIDENESVVAIIEDASLTLDAIQDSTGNSISIDVDGDAANPALIVRREGFGAWQSDRHVHQ